jgi:hypothetical protein
VCYSTSHDCAAPVFGLTLRKVMPEVAGIVSTSVMLGTMPSLTAGVSVNVNSLFCSIAALGPFLTTSMIGRGGGIGEVPGCRRKSHHKHNRPSETHSRVSNTFLEQRMSRWLCA